jgi:hypothetical protein
MRHTRIWTMLTVGFLVTALLGGVAAADSDPLTGTWHQRDNGTSNIFYFIDEPVGGVYPVLFYDDFTGDAVCGDNGPMMWSGFVTETDPNVFSGSFGNYWCPDNGDGVAEHPFGEIPSPFSVELEYDPETDTISGGIGTCVGERQEGLDNPNEAAEEIAEGEYPPPDPNGDC